MAIDFGNIDLSEAYNTALKNAKAKSENAPLFSMEEIRRDVGTLMDAMKTDELVISATITTLRKVDPKYAKLDHSRLRSAVKATKMYEIYDTDKGSSFRRLDRKFPLPIDQLPPDVAERVTTKLMETEGSTEKYERSLKEVKKNGSK
jgi:hypothetical protein